MPSTQPIRRGYGLCGIPGCMHPARSSVSPYCSTHHSRARVHGDPSQTLVTRREISPHEDRVRKVIATGNQAVIVASLKEIARVLKDHAEAELNQYRRGVARDRNLITACDQIVKVSKSVDPVETATTIGALFLLQDYDRRRFVSDEGMLGQVVRQFRLPAGIARGVTYNRQTGKDVGWFRPLTKKATAYMARMIIDAYTPWIVRLRMVEGKLRDDEGRIARQLAQAFE